MRKIFLSSLVALCIMLTFAGTAFAGNDFIDFKFYIPNGEYKYNDPSRYRQTTNINNSWKVRLDSSDEGTGVQNTITNFYISGESFAWTRWQASNKVPALEGHNAYRTAAWENASQTNIWLTGEDNYYGGDYNVKGIWDEETGLAPN